MLGDKVKDFEYSNNWRFDETSNEDSKVVPKASGVVIVGVNIFAALFHGRGEGKRGWALQPMTWQASAKQGSN